jgi:uncharacterized membrane protein
MTAVFFAALSLLCASVNDVLFKLHTIRQRVFGPYLAFVGVVWALFFCLMSGSGGTLGMSGVSLFWGTVSGAFSIMSNILLVAALGRHEVGVCATIYRLNLAPAAVFAMLFMGESCSVMKAAGVAAAAAAVIMFANPGALPSSGSGAAAALRLALAASLLRAGMGLSYKCGINHGAEPLAMLTVNGVFWAAGGVIYYCVFERMGKISARVTLVFGAASGIFVCGIVLFLMMALQRGDASVALPVSQLSFAVTAAAGAVFLGEKISAGKAAGLALAFLCVIFMSLQKG